MPFWDATTYVCTGGYELVPLFKVIANPGKYHGKQVEVSGFLARERNFVGPDTGYLYLSEDHARLSDRSSGIEVFVRNLDDPSSGGESSNPSIAVDSSCFGRFVTLRGRFELYEKYFPVIDLEAVITSANPEREFCWQLSRED